MTNFKTIDDFNPSGRRVLVRTDLNVPMKDGQVTDSTRIERAAPTIDELAGKGAKVVLLSHYGRPKGKYDATLSLEPLAGPLSEALGGRSVAFAKDCVGAEADKAVARLGDGEVALLENVRFHTGEEANDPAFARALAALADIYVDDAFAASHRTHASIEAVGRLLPAYAGRLMQAELKALTGALNSPERPVTAIVGGAKVSTKIELLGNLVTKVDRLIIGGGMANTFLFARGLDVGASLAERDLVDTVRGIEQRALESGCDILIQDDAVVALALAPGVETHVVTTASVQDNQMILDAGPRSVERFRAALSDSRTVVWNGPLGAFETPPFDAATLAVANHVAELTRAGQLLSVVGGGDTVAALSQAGAVDSISYVSTAGGAFLEWLEGKTLPGVRVLQKR